MSQNKKKNIYQVVQELLENHEIKGKIKHGCHAGRVGRVVKVHLDWGAVVVLIDGQRLAYDDASVEII